MPVVQLDGAAIGDWNGFHQACRSAFGFPDFYGNNLSAWIDCLSGLRDDDGMTRFSLAADDVLEIELLGAAVLRTRAPDILDALEDCVAEVNLRCEEAGEAPVLRLTLR